MESKTKRKMASSAINGGGKIIDSAVEVVKNTDSLHHWDFLDEIEAPMWADLSLCDLTNDETDDRWFDICHQFHQCSSSQLISTVFHSNKAGGSSSVSTQEPPSPKLPSSVSKSRGKTYKIKEWEQKRCKDTSNKKHPVKILTKKSSGSLGSDKKVKSVSKNGKLKEIKGPNACSSCESSLTDNSRPNFSKSSSSSLARLEQEQDSSSKSTVTSGHSERQENKCVEVSGQTSSQTSGLLSSLRINLRRSCATRPAARVVANGGRRSEGCKSSSSKSSVGSPLDQGSFGKKSILKDAQNKLRTQDGISVTRVSEAPKNKTKVPNLTKAPALNVRSLSNRQGNNTLASKITSKGKVQQHTVLGKVLIARKVNEQNQIIDKENKKVSVGKPASLASIKETASSSTATCQKAKSGDKPVQPIGRVDRASKQSLAQKNCSKKLIGLKQEKTNNRNKDTDAAKIARKVYFR